MLIAQTLSVLDSKILSLRRRHHVASAEGASETITELFVGVSFFDTPNYYWRSERSCWIALNTLPKKAPGPKSNQFRQRCPCMNPGSGRSATIQEIPLTHSLGPSPRGMVISTVYNWTAFGYANKKILNFDKYTWMGQKIWINCRCYFYVTRAAAAS